MGSSFSTGIRFLEPSDAKSDEIVWEYKYTPKYAPRYIIGIDLAWAEEEKGPRRKVIADEGHLGRRVIINE